MYDICIIGAGVCGCFLAHRLTHFPLRILWLEQAADVADHMPPASTATIHSGYDLEPGGQAAAFCLRGNAMYAEICRELQVPFQRTSAFVNAQGTAGEAQLRAQLAQAQARGIPAFLLTGDAAREKEPTLASDVTFALELPSTGTVDPTKLVLALAEEAVLNGAELRLKEKVVDIQRMTGRFVIRTNVGIYETHLLINAAGHQADELMIENAAASLGFYHVAIDKGHGLTAAPAIAEHVTEEFFKDSFDHRPKSHFLRRRPPLHVADMMPRTRRDLIRAWPSAGRILCLCRQVSEAEILDTIHRPVGARTVPGVKRRIDAGLGPCQGGRCEKCIEELLARELEKTECSLSSAKRFTACFSSAAPSFQRGGHIMRTINLVVIGGGPAGAAAARQAHKAGCRDILLLTHGQNIAGTLQKGIRRETEATALHLGTDKCLTYVSPSSGYQQIQARAVILATGSRPLPAGVTLTNDLFYTPENTLCLDAGLDLHPVTQGPLVNESLETSDRGVFACGNALHLHDHPDTAIAEGRRAGNAAASYLHGTLTHGPGFPVLTRGPHIACVLPASVCPANIPDTQDFTFLTSPATPSGTGLSATLRLYRDNIPWRDLRLSDLAPGKPNVLTLKKEDLAPLQYSLTFELILSKA